MSLKRLLGLIFYRFVQAWGWLFRLTPYFLKNFLASIGAFVWFYLVGFRRRIVLLNLAAAFPRKPEEASVDFRDRIYSLARENFKNYFLGLFEVIEKTTYSYDTLMSKIVIIGGENVVDATKDGSGIFLLGAHMGNWETMLAMGKRFDRQLSVIVRYVRNSFWDEVLKQTRIKFPVNLLPEESSGIQAIKSYKRGGMVVFVLDQHTGEPHGVLAKFFGLKAWSAKGLAVIAGRLGAKVLPSFSYRKDGKIHIIIEPPMKFDDLGECREDAQILEHVQRCNDKIEEYIRKNPAQYFWVHRRFKAAINYKEDKLPFP